MSEVLWSHRAPEQTVGHIEEEDGTAMVLFDDGHPDHFRLPDEAALGEYRGRTVHVTGHDLRPCPCETEHNSERYATDVGLWIYACRLKGWLIAQPREDSE